MHGNKTGDVLRESWARGLKKHETKFPRCL